MVTAILYESEEWSVYALRDRLCALGTEVILVNLEEAIPYEALRDCHLVISRIFASAQFRGHERSLLSMEAVHKFLKEQGIRMVNSYQAHQYEVSKELSTKTLEKYGIGVPEVYGTFRKEEVYQLPLVYPLILKPDCGGRTNDTYIVKSESELREIVPGLRDITMIAEEYLEPVYGYLTRIEVIGGECRLIVKRSVTENGLSAYRFGSSYERYDDCRDSIRETAVRAMALLEIEMGSLDIIETESGFYIIDVNAVSNVSEDNTEMFQFDLMKEMAEYLVEKYGNEVGGDFMRERV